ncbi:MAG: hypothetical protein J2P37_28650, partial [Ktedonobacteraceae bacterium]|nr:hypothetical protein [Ktedonobacteraceae bacterium]
SSSPSASRRRRRDVQAPAIEKGRPLVAIRNGISYNIHVGLRLVTYAIYAHTVAQKLKAF